jgi:hypothetical protein
MPTLLTPQEIGFVMMIVGYTLTITAIGRLLINALAWALTQLVTQTTHFMEQYAPRWLKILDLKIQFWITLPSWVSWKIDEWLVSALERIANRFRTVNNRKQSRLLEEMEDWNTRYNDVMSK